MTRRPQLGQELQIHHTSPDFSQGRGRHGQQEDGGQELAAVIEQGGFFVLPRRAERCSRTEKKNNLFSNLKKSKLETGVQMGDFISVVGALGALGPLAAQSACLTQQIQQKSSQNGFKGAKK